MYLNSVTVIGNITKDIELKVLPNGTKIANFSVATNRTWYNDKKEKMEEVEFHNIVAFGNQAENIAKYMTKGSNILIEGRLKTQSWEDTATQKKMYRTEIIAEKVQFGYNKENVAQETKKDT
jgi:single-strand DNA-binding protein